MKNQLFRVLTSNRPEVSAGILEVTGVVVYRDDDQNLWAWDQTDQEWVQYTPDRFQASFGHQPPILAAGFWGVFAPTDFAQCDQWQYLCDRSEITMSLRSLPFDTGRPATRINMVPTPHAGRVNVSENPIHA